LPGGRRKPGNAAILGPALEGNESHVRPPIREILNTKVEERLRDGPAQLMARRKDLEELFRDDKTKRNGCALRHTQITKPDRLDRLLRMLALA